MAAKLTTAIAERELYGTSGKPAETMLVASSAVRPSAGQQRGGVGGREVADRPRSEWQLAVQQQQQTAAVVDPLRQKVEDTICEMNKRPLTSSNALSNLTRAQIVPSRLSVEDAKSILWGIERSPWRMSHRAPAAESRHMSPRRPQQQQQQQQQVGRRLLSPAISPPRGQGSGSTKIEVWDYAGFGRGLRREAREAMLRPSLR